CTLGTFYTGPMISIPVEACCLCLALIVKATNDFSICNKLGKGGLGSVYRGTLEDGQGIAVKRF
ncbi:hypothetical protein QQP08_020574, partial [Theobroma cacao]